LVLHDGEPTITELKNVAELPRVAFMNACEAARVRGAPSAKPAAFAEVFLRSGVEAYLGKFWRVGDSAASTFAREVYSSLAQGETLDAAVRQGRVKLLDAQEPDWANYILYGDGRFQLVVG
jgi:CHAT domain-containing protein